MKITRVEPFHVDWGGGRTRSAWVRIWTDAGDSVYGLGEASPMAHGNASLEIVASAFTPMLLGADPLERRVIQDRLFHQHIYPAEYNGPRDVQDVVFRTPVRPVRGKFVLGDSPGLGLELDEAELRKRMVPWTSSAASA